MKINIADTYAAMSKQAAAETVRLMQSSTNPLLCTASGDTPAGLYKELVNIIITSEVDISAWKFVGLDEWGGMNEDDEGSCRYHLNNQFFKPLNIPDKNICFFNGRADNLGTECERVEQFIQQLNGIDAAILGLGLNGHIGMNEPGTSVISRSHIAAIDPHTQQVGQKYFKAPRQLDKGITLGLATLLEAKNIILLVSGAHKAEIAKKIMNEEISEQVPATLLRDNPGLKVYLDKDAAKFLQP